MKKLISLAAAFAALTLTASAAFAATANATIVAPNTEKITAPFAGTLLTFDLRQGDSVAANETLFTMDTTPVYATRHERFPPSLPASADDALRCRGALRLSRCHRAEKRAVYRRFHPAGV